MKILNYLIEAGILSGLLALGWLLVRSLPDLRARRVYLFAGLLAVLLLPLLPAPYFGPLPTTPQWPAWMATPGSGLNVNIEALAPVESLARNSEGGLSSGPPALNWTFEWNKIILLIYLVGLVLSSIETVRAANSLRRLLWGCRPTPLEGVSVLRKGKGIAFAFHRRVYLSPDVVSHPDLGMLLTHERAHLRERHGWDVILGEIARTLLWVNPLIWWLTRAQRDTLEYQADRAVLDDGYDRRHYQLSLLNHATGGTAWPLRFNAPTRWKTRIDMMFQAPGRRSWTALTLTVLLLLLGAVHLLLAQPKLQQRAAVACGPCKYDAADEFAPEVEAGHTPLHVEMRFYAEPSLEEWYQIRGVLQRLLGNSDLSIYPSCGTEGGLTYQLGRGMMPTATITSADIAAAREAGRVAVLELALSDRPEVPEGVVIPQAAPDHPLPPAPAAPPTGAVTMVVDGYRVPLEASTTTLADDPEGLPVPPRKRLNCLLDCQDGPPQQLMPLWNRTGVVKNLLRDPNLLEDSDGKVRYYYNTEEVGPELLQRTVAGRNVIMAGTCNPASGEFVVLVIDDMTW